MENCKSCEHMEVPDESIDLVVTSPPYWNAIDYEQHVEDPTAWYRTRKGGPYEEYLDWLERCFREVFRVLKPGRCRHWNHSKSCARPGQVLHWL